MLCQRVEDNAFHLRSVSLNCYQNGLALFSQRRCAALKFEKKQNKKQLIQASSKAFAKRASSGCARDSLLEEDVLCKEELSGRASRSS
jgi:hypothetical protein